MEPLRIDIGEYVHSGEGANGESLFHRSNPDIMLKLYNQGAPLDIVINELELSHKVYEAGLPVPAPGDLVTDGKRIGIRFQRIPGKISFSRSVGDNPDRVEEYARRFAALCKDFHSMHMDKGQFSDVKVIDKGLLAASPFFSEREKEKISAFIDSAPDCDAPCHGDLQFSNAVIAADGSEYFIDLGDFAYGHPYFDLGMVLLTCVYDDEAFIRETFHMSKATALEFWKYFVKGYFGEDASPDEIERILRPYAGLKVLIIERNAGVPFPQYHNLLDGILA